MVISSKGGGYPKAEKKRAKKSKHCSMLLMKGKRWRCGWRTDRMRLRWCAEFVERHWPELGILAFVDPWHFTSRLLLDFCVRASLSFIAFLHRHHPAATTFTRLVSKGQSFILVSRANCSKTLTTLLTFPYIANISSPSSWLLPKPASSSVRPRVNSSIVPSTDT